MNGPMIQFVPALTDEHIRDAVLHARAMVEIADRLDRAQATIADRDRQIAELRESARRAEQERQRLLGRIFAVHNVHRELTEVACGDGCCHEGLGTCASCEEPWPCRTYRASDGKPYSDDDEAES